MRITGMFQLLGTTYRVSRVSSGRYLVIRIRDEVVAGSFSCGKSLEVVPMAVGLELMKRLAAAAVYGGKTSWMGPSVSL